MPRQHLDHDWFSHPLPTNVRLGDGTWLYSSYAFSHYRSQASIGLWVGSDTGLYHGTFFDLGRDAEVRIGDYCSLVGVIFATNGRVHIGDYTFIAHEVVFADTPWPKPDLDRANTQRPATTTSGENSIEIGRNVWIGAQAIVLSGVRIGEGAIIGAGTLVARDVPPYTVCAGNPMRILRTIPCGEDSRD